jgi:hypothetical protein
VLVLGITAFDAWGSHIRAQAYQATVAAAVQGDEKTIMAEADRFFAAWTLHGSDPREDHVRQLRQDVVETPNRKIRDAAIEKIRNANQRGDRKAAMEAAEQFLGAPPIRVADSRWDQVVDLYARDFIDWFADLAEPIDEAARMRIQGYKKLVISSAAGGRNP